jgi:hypothetical protein
LSFTSVCDIADIANIGFLMQVGFCDFAFFSHAHWCMQRVLTYICSWPLIMGSLVRVVTLDVDIYLKFVFSLERHDIYNSSLHIASISIYSCADWNKLLTDYFDLLVSAHV